MKQLNYKYVLAVFLMMISILPAIAQKEYQVKDAAELLAAIGSNRTIILDQGPQYNLSKVLGTAQINRMITSAGSKLSVDDCFDGLELHISQVENLTIRGAGDKPVRLVVEPRYAYVLTFLNCKNITLENLEIGHTPEQGYCTGGVLQIKDSENITVQNCRLFGCGTEGATIANSKYVYFGNTDIYECTYQIFTIEESARIQFDKCRFYDNQEFSLINVIECIDIILTDCLIYDNYGKLLYVNSPVMMTRCKIWHPKNKLGDHMLNIQQEDCIWYDVEPKQIKEM